MKTVGGGGLVDNQKIDKGRSPKVRLGKNVFLFKQRGTGAAAG